MFDEGSVFYAVLYLAVAVVVMCEGAWFLHRFRTRKQIPTQVLSDEEKRFQVLWAIVPPLILVFLFAKGMR